MRATFTVSYTDTSSATHTQSYTTAYTAAATSVAQATIAANTTSGVFSIPNSTTFTWSVVAQTESDGKLSAPTQCGGVTSSGQVPAATITGDENVTDGTVGDKGGFTFDDVDNDPSTGVIEYAYSFTTVLPDLDDLACGTVADIETSQISGLTCAGDQSGDDSGDGDGVGGNESWAEVDLVIPSTAYSITVWAVDADRHRVTGHHGQLHGR